MADFGLLENFIIALVLGALIGLEREYARYRHRGHEYAGIRTFPLISLFGALSAYLGATVSPYLLIAGLLIIGAMIIIAYFNVTKASRLAVGATSEVAGFLAFFIGILCYYGEFGLAISLTVIITIILYARSVLHHFAEKIKKEEMGDTLKFVLIAFVILPLLPDKGYGPYGLFNPHSFWLMVVFVSGISFVGYILLKWFGEKGIALTGITGGLVSSTATTISFAQRSKKERPIYKALILGVILANSIMFVKVMVEVFAVNRNLFLRVFIPLLILLIISLVVSYFLWKKAKYVKGKIELKSPFTLVPALKFAVIFAVILAAVELAKIYLGSNGVYLASFLAGLADVDAITLSLSELAKTTLDETVAVKGILIATLTNVGIKGGLAYFMGGKEFGKTILVFYSFLIILGLAIILII